jgi:hypothetical protein
MAGWYRLARIRPLQHLCTLGHKEVSGLDVVKSASLLGREISSHFGRGILVQRPSVTAAQHSLHPGRGRW